MLGRLKTTGLEQEDNLARGGPAGIGKRLHISLRLIYRPTLVNPLSYRFQALPFPSTLFCICKVSMKGLTLTGMPERLNEVTETRVQSEYQ